MRSPAWLEILALDFRYTCRRLLQQPAFAVVACLSLALGIGANTAAFSVLYAVLLRGLPVKDPATLVVVSTRYTGFQYSMSYPAYTYLRDHTSSLDGLVSFRNLTINVNSGGATDRVSGMLVSGNYFSVLGVDTVLGASIRPEDDQTSESGGPQAPVAVLSHQYWTKRFGQDAGVVGRTIRVDGRPVTIAGVAPAAFRGTRVGSLPDLYLPMAMGSVLFESATHLTNPRNNWLRIIGRVKRGTSLAQAQAELTVVLRQFNRDVILPLATTDTARQRARDGIIVLQPGRTGLLELGPTVAPTLLVLMGLVGLVLLVACANVASLLVARAERRHRETAIAIALGATRGRLWSQQFVESLAIALMGVALGLVFAIWMKGVLVQLVPSSRELDVSMDTQVLVVSLALGVMAALFFGTLMAWQTRRLGVARSLKGEDVGGRSRLRQGLVVGQLALAVMVLVAAALFLQTLTRLQLVDPGFDRERILIASTAPRGYSAERRKIFYQRLLDDVRDIPGVVVAAYAEHEPLAVNTGWNMTMRPRPSDPPEQIAASVAYISPDYFRTMGIALLRGRDFDARDESSPLRPVVVNENFVRTYFKAQDALGQTIVGNGGMTFEIVGIVKDSASLGLRDLDQHMLYLPGGRGVLHVRAAVPPASLASAIEAAVRRLDPDVPVFNVRTIDQQIDLFMGRERTLAALSSTLGLLALLLSAVGLYGVMANAVSRRTRELGIRLALGAAPRGLIQLVLREAGLLVALGVAAGLPCAYLIGRSLDSMLYGVQPGDWRSVGLSVTVLLIVAIVAAWVPARRAAHVDPLIALRSE